MKKEKKKGSRIMDQLIKKIEQWGYDKNIHLASPLMQTTKTLEEAIELMQGVFRNGGKKCNKCNFDVGCEGYSYIYSHETKYKDHCKHITEIKDAIGDIFVTLVMLSIQVKDVTIRTDQKTTLDGYVNEETKNIFYQTFIMQHNIQKKHSIDRQINNIVFFLKYIAKNYDLTLKECVEYAYNEIKDRKGEMKKGLWVKND